MAIWISHTASIAILFAGAACMMIAPSASAQAKDAEPATRQANAEVLRSLPFADRTDFDDAQRGFIASLPDGLVLGDGQRVVWSMKPYAFQQKAAAPATVNPSLWRQAQLDNFHGLFKVTDRVYQVRGLDDSNITIVESDTGLIVIDALLSAETARAGMELYYQHRPRKPVVAVVFTHAHADHFGGVKGVVSENDVRAGRVKIFAPDHFTEHAVTESIVVGNAIRRRGMYQFGPLLPPGERGQIDAGHGKTVSRGTFTLIAPTDLIKDSYELRTIDGVDIEFHLVPGSEAPAEMTLYFPQFKVLDMAEDTNHTMHNLYTLRGAEVRDARLWSSYIGEALDRYGDRTDALIAQHQWPTWGGEKIATFLKRQRDMYKFIHDQSVRLLNHGYTPIEIADQRQSEAAVVIGVRIGGQRGIIDQEPDIGPVRIALLYRQHDWLILRIADTPGGMRQERIVAIGPQMGVERVGPLLRRRLHDNAPATLQRFFKQRRQNVVERHVLQMVEQNFRHPVFSYFLAS